MAIDWATIIASAITGVCGFACGVLEARHKDKATATAKRIEAREKYFYEAGLCLNVRRLSIHFKTATEVLIPYLNRKQTKSALAILELMRTGNFDEADRELIAFSARL